ncbi:MAG: NUDIX hydrolase [Bacteroidetes bacterium]|nr:NUDIX hydrolase [Bacteroidota bacterium]HET6243326.1 NUDIX hydrolase [Bacteroidia bacterium]
MKVDKFNQENGNREKLLDNPWKTLSIAPVFDSPWINVTKHEIVNPAGNDGEYSVVHFKNIAIGILPLDDEFNTWIVGQFRYPINKYSWEIPEGGGKLSISPLESAKRELLEETGIVAKKWTQIQEMHLSNSVSDEYAVIFIAQQLSFEEAQPEETEQLQVKKIPFDELFQMVMNGEITDSMSVAAVLKTKILIDSATL